MREAFITSREYDYVRLDGLSRATGRPAHEWDIYILKELIDNALDADEVLWSQDNSQSPSLFITVQYSMLPMYRRQQLIISVKNRAIFPLKKIPIIFNTQWYTSSKTFVKRLTRGTLGNALKTLLGIPYALHHRVYGDWNPQLKPFSIYCDNKEYLPSFILNTTAQSIQFAYYVKPYKATEGTTMVIRLDDFSQEVPRTLAEIKALAQSYHLCNPHTYFHWNVEIEKQLWQEEYFSKKTWQGKFRGIAPLSWYSFTTFKELLSALYRQHCENGQSRPLSLNALSDYFADPTLPNHDHVTRTQSRKSLPMVLQDLGQENLSEQDLGGPPVKKLYELLIKNDVSFESSQLGAIGLEHISDVLGAFFPIRGNIHYDVIIENDSELTMPFVIEIAAAFLREGKREVLTAINFSPTYGDPFQSRWLRTPLRPDETALGLRGFLEAYSFHEDTPILLFLHIICPNIEHSEFSKTEINHLPFKGSLVASLDTLLTNLSRSRQEEELRLEQEIYAALDVILRQLNKDERLVIDQLVEQLRQKLGQDQKFASWLQGPDVPNRLQNYVIQYQEKNLAIKRHIVYEAEPLLHLPMHPEHRFSTSIEHVSNDLLVDHSVNKILYVYGNEFEPVILKNNWLCLMDMALLHLPSGSHSFGEILQRLLNICDLPIVLLHNADKEGFLFAEEVQALLEHHPARTRVIDLGLHSSTTEHTTTFLIEFMPHELEQWLKLRLAQENINVKFSLSDAELRHAIRRRFDELLQLYILDGIKRKLGIASLLIELETTFSLVNALQDAGLDTTIQRHLQQKQLSESYSNLVDTETELFFHSFIDTHKHDMQSIIHHWINK